MAKFLAPTHLKNARRSLSSRFSSISNQPAEANRRWSDEGKGKWKRDRPFCINPTSFHKGQQRLVGDESVIIQITARSVLRMRELLQASQTCFTNRGQKQAQRTPLCHEEWAPPTQTRIQFPHNKTGHWPSTWYWLWGSLWWWTAAT